MRLCLFNCNGIYSSSFDGELQPPAFYRKRVTAIYLLTAVVKKIANTHFLYNAGGRSSPFKEELKDCTCSTRTQFQKKSKNPVSRG